MIETIISDVLHRMIEDITPEQGRQLETALYVVLDKYSITEKSTSVATVEKSWQEDLQRFIDRKRISGKSEKTLERYDYIMNRVLGYINKPISEVTEGDLNDFIEKYKRFRQVSNTTLEGFRLCISSFFTWQHERGYIQRNPARGVDPIKCPKRLKKAYTDEDMEKLRRQCEHIRDMALIEFLYSTGVRISELCALNRDDIRISDKEIVIYGKGAKEREVYLTPVSCMYLSAYLYQRQDDNPALFVSHKKPYSRLNPGGVRAMLKKIGLAAGVEKVHPHRFRTTLATNLIKKGMPVEEVKVILGHEKIDTTLLYALVDKSKVKSDLSRLLSA